MKDHNVSVPKSTLNVYPLLPAHRWVHVAILTALAPHSPVITPETRQMALDAAETINRLESKENGHTEEAVLNAQMEAMTVALIEADAGLRDVDIQQLVLGTGELNGSTELLETRLETIINKIRGEK